MRFRLRGLAASLPGRLAARWRSCELRACLARVLGARSSSSGAAAPARDCVTSRCCLASYRGLQGVFATGLPGAEANRLHCTAGALSAALGAGLRACQVACSSSNRSERSGLWGEACQPRPVDEEWKARQQANMWLNLRGLLLCSDVSQ